MSTQTRPRTRLLRVGAAAPLSVAALLAAVPTTAGANALDVAAAGPGLEALAVAPSVAPVAPPAPERRFFAGTITAGSTLFGLLRKDGVPARTIDAVARRMSDVFDFRRARPGHDYELVLDGEDRVVEFHYRISPDEGWSLLRTPEGFAITREEPPLVARPARVAGVITTNLYGSLTDLGAEGQLARDFADIFAWDIDFQREVQPGDSYRILYEKLFRAAAGGDLYVRPGRILAARFEGRAGIFTAVYYQTSEEAGGYYRPDGSSVEGHFLKAPVSQGRITSSYTSARRHPILNVTRPHPGIDYAAPSGTPVWAVADGIVVHRGWSGGFGNLLKVEHDGGFVSYYGHLSRYASDLRVGSRVNQKQVIGYVGSTGLATGPHVCFRIKQNGSYVDPASLGTSAGPPIPIDQVALFRNERDELLARLDGRRWAAATP